MTQQVVKGNIKFSISPVNRPAEFSYETNDCTVRALSVAAGVPYGDAHKEMAIAGRRSRHGAKLTDLHRMADGPYVYGYKVTRVILPAGVTTLGRALPYVQRGRYIVVKTGHAIGCIDGVFYDSGTLCTSSRSKLYAIYKFTPSSEWEAKQSGGTL